MEQSDIVKTAARAAHEANRAWCILIGDHSQLPWEDAAEWQRESAIKGIDSVLAGAGPKEQHEAWMADKVAAGWVYGPVKDAAAIPPTHPCLVAYDDLSEDQRKKDYIYIAVVKAILNAGGLS